MDKEEKSICNNILSMIKGRLRTMCDSEIFNKLSFAELGEFYYELLINSVEGASIDLINIVVSRIGELSHCDNQILYYEKICNILGVELLPQKVLNDVHDAYDDIFRVRFNDITQKYNDEISRLKNELSEIKTASDRIKNKKASYSIVRDISEDEEQLYRLSEKCNLLRTRKEMIEYAFCHVKTVMGEFCDLQNVSEIDVTLRKTALSLSKEKNETIRNGYFYIYKNCLELFEDDIEREYMLFFKVKTYTVIEKANKKYHSMSFKYTDEEAIKEYKDYLSKIPKIDDLHLWKTNDLSRYREALSKLMEDYDLIDDLKKLINTSVCLKRRKDMLLKVIAQFEQSEYEIFNNLISIQIEGMFADYLRDATTFARFNKMTIYEDAILKDKIRHLEEAHSGIYHEAIEYFMFYFNNHIRNRIAHGRYYGSTDRLKDEIFSKELILDLCLLVHMLVRTSETERMYRFIHGYQSYYRKLIKSTEHSSYGALFNDMIGQKIVSDYDGMRKYRPIQVAYWIVNPYYEKIYEQVEDKSDLLSLRDEFLSAEFWKYVYERLSEVQKNGYDYLNIHTEFSSVIKALFRCNISDETKQVLRKVSALTDAISNCK